MLTLAIITVICILFIIALFIASYFKIQKKLKTQISFKESIDLTELPVITMTCKGTKLNFLLDTGSNDSYVAEMFTELLGKPSHTIVTEMTGFNTKTTVEGYAYDLELSYKSNTFKECFLASEGLNVPFSHMKQEYGVQVHGIIGTKFLQKYKYIIDFDELVAYPK